jgi:hypothetical protein
VQNDLTRSDGDRLRVVEADAVDPIATLGKRPRLTLDAGVDGEVRAVNHADP